MRAAPRSSMLALCALLGGNAAAASEPRDSDNLYARVAAKLAADPALAESLGKPGPEMAAVSWLLGEWNVVAEVQATERASGAEQGVSKVTTQLGGTLIEHRDTYPSGTQDLGFLSYSPATKLWTAIGLDSVGNAIVTRGRVTPDGLVFEGDVAIVGVPTYLRQTIRRLGDDAYLLTNEERRENGAWQLLDTYRYTRAKRP